jgi:hypothetical protein
MKKFWLLIVLAGIALYLFSPGLLPMLALPVFGAVTRDRTRFNVKGGGMLKLRQISPAASNTFLDVGYLGGTDFNDTKTNVTQKDEKGIVVNFNESEQEVILKSLLKQTGIDEIGLLKGSTGIYYEAYYSALLTNGNTQELNFPCCKVDASVKLGYKPGDRMLDITIHALAVKAAFVRNPVGYNIAADQAYVLVENAVALGAPADTAAAVATGVL